MSKFHFSVDMANEVKKSLSDLEEFMQECERTANNLISDLMNIDSFGVFEAINKMREEIKCISGIGCMSKRGVGSISDIINSTDNSENMAVKFTQAAIDTGINAINNVIKSDSENNYAQIPSKPTPNPLENYPVGSWIDGLDKNYIYKPNNGNSNIRVDKETGGENYIMLIPTAENMFDKGTYRGYIQTTKEGNNGWFYSDYQCVATAVATTSMYNGKNETPYDRYSHWDYQAGYNGYATGCIWSEYAGMSAQEFFDYCKSRLDDGKATTIYSHSDSSHDTGHAVTVIGYVNSGCENPIFDLWVVDPWDGGQYRLGDCWNMMKRNDGNFTIELNG